MSRQTRRQPSMESRPNISATGAQSVQKTERFLTTVRDRIRDTLSV